MGTRLQLTLRLSQDTNERVSQPHGGLQAVRQEQDGCAHRVSWIVSGSDLHTSSTNWGAGIALRRAARR